MVQFQMVYNESIFFTRFAENNFYFIERYITLINDQTEFSNKEFIFN